MNRALIVISLEGYTQHLLNPIMENVLEFSKTHNANVDVEEMFDYAILKGLTGVLGVNLIKDYLLTEMYDIFYNQYLENIALSIAMNIIKMHSLNYLVQFNGRIKTLVTFHEIIFSYSLTN